MKHRQTREQIVAAQRRTIMLQWIIIGALAAVTLILLAGMLQAGAVDVDKPRMILPGELLGAEMIGPEPTSAWTDADFAAVEVIRDTSPAISLGTFKLYAYCSCAQCCGKWAGGPTASGVMPKAGRTIAVDPQVIPLGSLVLINGVSYIAEDTGAGIDGAAIDIYMDSHQAAVEHGVQEGEVWLVRD